MASLALENGVAVCRSVATPILSVPPSDAFASDPPPRASCTADEQPASAVSETTAATAAASRLQGRAVVRMVVPLRGGWTWDVLVSLGSSGSAQPTGTGLASVVAWGARGRRWRTVRPTLPSGSS